MSTVLTADNSTLLNQIGSKVCQAIIAIQVQQPEFLLDKYRDMPWQSSRHQSGLINKLIEVLAQAKDETVTQQLLQKFLRALLTPESFSSPILVSLFKEVTQLSLPQAAPQVALVNGNGATTTSENSNHSHAADSKTTIENTVEIQSAAKVHTETIQVEDNSVVEAPQVETQTENTQNTTDTLKAQIAQTANIEISEPISEQISEQISESTIKTNNIASAQTGFAVLLLDAENLQINSETEKFLSSVCQYPIQVKVAFANWCRKGKLDAELHTRNYDLIHVPSGRDNADGKMITFGSSIHQRFPNAKEVFVCSSDNVMTNLCNHMLQNGLNVFRVVKQGSNLTVLDIQSGETHIHTVLPTIEQFINQIKEIIREEEVRTTNQWMKLSKISKIFHNKHNIGVNQVVSHHFRGKTAKDIFIDNADFAVHHLAEDLETFIALFKLPQSNKSS